MMLVTLMTMTDCNGDDDEPVLLAIMTIMTLTIVMAIMVLTMMMVILLWSGP